MDREAFARAVYSNWAERFHCSVEELHFPGTVLLQDEEFAGSGAIHIWTIGRRAFARMDPNIEPEIVRVLGDRPDDTALTQDHLRATLTPNRIDRVEAGVLRYLYPPDFIPVQAPEPYLIRTLAAADAAALAAMKAACSAEEVEMGEVSVDDEIGFGCFLVPSETDVPRMAAIATGFRLTAFMDIGVLTHPADRRRGLGKAVVGALCAWCIDQPVIAQYRCDVTNAGSYAIAQALGFALTFTQQSIYLRLSNE